MKFAAAVLFALLLTTSRLSAQPGYCRDTGARRAARVTVGTTAVAGNVGLFLRRCCAPLSQKGCPR